jgi:hypothetical protein
MRSRVDVGEIVKDLIRAVVQVQPGHQETRGYGAILAPVTYENSSHWQSPNPAVHRHISPAG